MLFKKKNAPKKPKDPTPEAEDQLKIRLDSIETESVKEQLEKIRKAKDEK